MEEKKKYIVREIYDYEVETYSANKAVSIIKYDWRNRYTALPSYRVYTEEEYKDLKFKENNGGE